MDIGDPVFEGNLSLFPEEDDDDLVSSSLPLSITFSVVVVVVAVAVAVAVAEVLSVAIADDPVALPEWLDAVPDRVIHHHIVIVTSISLC